MSPQYARLGIHFQRPLVTASVTICELYCLVSASESSLPRKLPYPLRIPLQIGSLRHRDLSSARPLEHCHAR